MTALVEASDLSLGTRLRPTTLEIGTGELVCLVGPNGSGKTSLLHALAGIGGPSGQVRLGGTNPWRLPPAQRQRLFAFLPASRDVKWPLLASDLIRLAVPVDVEAEETVRALELEPLLGRRMDRLSTGERSRVLIARALAADPQLLLLDEPVANLDPLWQLKLMDLIRTRVRSGGRSAVIAIHDLEIARRYADRLIVMNRGGIEADGEPEALLSGPVIPSVFGIRWRETRWEPC